MNTQTEKNISKSRKFLKENKREREREREKTTIGRLQIYWLIRGH